MRLLLCLLCLSLLTGCHSKINTVPSKDSNTFVFLEEDLYVPSDLNELIELDLSKKPVVIDEPGSYVLSGNYDDTNLTISLKERGNVQLVLNNLNAQASKIPFLTVLTPTKVTISLAENTTNSLRSDQKVINSNGSLTFNGLGSLNIQSPTTAISSKKVITFAGGDYQFTSGNDAVIANEIIAIHSGNIKVSTQKNGLIINESDGLVYMLDGNLSITSRDLPIKNSGTTNIVGGTQTFKK